MCHSLVCEYDYLNFAIQVWFCTFWSCLHAAAAAVGAV
jgi:hypothetical protein